MHSGKTVFFFDESLFQKGVNNFNITTEPTLIVCCLAEPVGLQKVSSYFRNQAAHLHDEHRQTSLIKKC